MAAGFQLSKALSACMEDTKAAIRLKAEFLLSTSAARGDENGFSYTE